MTEKPILFSGPMVRAIIEGRKTQTRRVLTKANSLVDGCRATSDADAYNQWERLAFNGTRGTLRWGLDQNPDADGLYSMRPYRDKGGNGEYLHVPMIHEDGDQSVHRVYSKITIGTRLWVRETFATRRDLSHVEYRADRQEPVGLPFEHIYDERTKWRPSIFMPRRLSRINLLVTRVRCQRLQEIMEEDAIAEGVDASTFPLLWGVINEKRGFPWASNPWVWVYTFERILK